MLKPEWTQSWAIALSSPVWAGFALKSFLRILVSLQVFYFHLCLLLESQDVKWKLHVHQKGSFCTLLFPAGWALDQGGKEPARNFPLPLDGISLVEEMFKLLLIPVGVAWMMLLLHPRGHHSLRTGSELQQRLGCIENRKSRKKCSAQKRKYLQDRHW